MPKIQNVWMLGVFSIGLAQMAPAQGPGMAQQPRMSQQALDLNHDGVLSADEIKAAPKSLLTLDKNGDGKITANEVSPRPDNVPSPSDLADTLMAFDKDHKGYLVASDLPDRMQGIFTRGDANHDGKLTSDELKALGNKQTAPSGPANRGGNGNGGPFRFDPLLSALDTNHDGELSAEEIAAAATSLLVLDKNGNGQIDADEMRPRQMSPQERLNHLLEEFDTNKDGKITRDEAPERMQGEAFDKADTNHDGFLDKDELTAYFAQQGNQQRGRGPEGGQQQH